MLINCIAILFLWIRGPRFIHGVDADIEPTLTGNHVKVHAFEVYFKFNYLKTKVSYYHQRFQRAFLDEVSTYDVCCEKFQR